MQKGETLRPQAVRAWSYASCKAYVDVPLTFSRQETHAHGDDHYDAVLIDGRARAAAALRLLPWLHRRSILFFHDFFAVRLHHLMIARASRRLGVQQWTTLTAPGTLLTHHTTHPSRPLLVAWGALMPLLGTTFLISTTWTWTTRFTLTKRSRCCGPSPTWPEGHGPTLWN